MADVVASSSRSMQMLDDLSDIRREIHDDLKSLLEEFKRLNANDSGVARRIKFLLEVSNSVVRLDVSFLANDSGLDLDCKGMGRYVACQIKDILEFVKAEVRNRHSKKKKEKEKKRGIILRVRGLLGRFVGGQQDDDGIETKKVMQMLLYETEWMFNLLLGWLPDGWKRANREVGGLSGRSVVLPKVKHFVGMEKDLKQLVSSLTDPQQQQQRVVWVWGVAGLGKTTLATKIFMHPQVRSHFNAFAWVSLTQGQPYQIDSLLQNILEQLAGESSEKRIACVEIKQKFNDIQRRKKCFVVIDGIWEISQWKQISSTLLSTDPTSVTGTNPTSVTDTDPTSVTDTNPTSVTDTDPTSVTDTNPTSVTDTDPTSVTDTNPTSVTDTDPTSVTDTNPTSVTDTDTTSDTDTDTDTDSLSRILVTTQDETIACPDDVIVHKLSLLNENDGWELLRKHALCGNACPGKGIIPKLGKEMVRKCGYLPSTISRLGRALSKIDRSEWHTVNEDITRFLKEDDGGKSPSSEQTSVTVAQGYDRLRFQQKQCFLYLGIFKQDIDAEDLTFLWAAEGMLFAQQQDKDNGTIIDTAERYLQELNSEGMLKVKVDGLSANRMLMPLSLHNDQWALSRYHGEHEAFGLYVSDNSVGDIDSFDDIEQTRRLVFHFKRQVTSSLTDDQMQSAMHIRSLFFLNSDQEYVDLPVSMSNFEKLKLLRTVHFVRCKFKDRKLPEEIEKLVLLRYLGIIYCDLDKLPSSISNSGKLHVLNVRAYDDAKMTVPNIFSQPSQLSQMKHLRLPSNLEKEQSESDKLKLDGLLDLETLVGFNVDVHDIESLSSLEKLRLLVAHVGNNGSLTPIIKLVEDKGPTVQIHVVVENKCNFTSRDELPDLEEMLMCPQLYALTVSMVHIHEFPNCGAHSSSGLTQIKLIGCKLREDPMEALGKFPSLRKLCLGYGAFVGSKIEIRYHHDGGFKHLEYLEFRCLPNLEEWLVDSRAMPSLSTLTVKRCPKLKEIPGGLISCVSSLNNFEIELPPSALSKAKENEYKKMFSSVENFIIRKA